MKRVILPVICLTLLCFSTASFAGPSDQDVQRLALQLQAQQGKIDLLSSENLAAPQLGGALNVSEANAKDSSAPILVDNTRLNKNIVSPQITQTASNEFNADGTLNPPALPDVGGGRIPRILLGPPIIEDHAAPPIDVGGGTSQPPGCGVVGCGPQYGPMNPIIIPPGSPTPGPTSDTPGSQPMDPIILPPGSPAPVPTHD